MNVTTIALSKVQLPNGTEIAYYDSGQLPSSNEPAAVLLHGYCGSSAYWEQLVKLPLAAGRLIVPDLRGHGASSCPDSDCYEMEHFVEDIMQLMDSLTIERFVLLGHSLGGYITLAAAEQYADRLLGFGLLHSTAHPDSEEAKANRDKAVEAIQQDGLAAFVHGLVPKLFAEQHVELMGETVERMKQIGCAASQHGVMATARGMKVRPGRQAVLEQAAVPILLVAGEGDRVISPERTFSVSGALVYNALLEDCGHMGMVEATSKLADEISAFMKICSNRVQQ